MVEQPECGPGAFANRQLGFDLEVAIGLVILAIGVDGAVEELTGAVTLRPDFQLAVFNIVVLGVVAVSYQILSFQTLLLKESKSSLKVRA
jgi:hypothetical protein